MTVVIKLFHINTSSHECVHVKGTPFALMTNRKPGSLPEPYILQDEQTIILNKYERCNYINQAKSNTVATVKGRKDR